ncbi:MAG: hypothetical protein M3N53_06300 [Actinomycetota bacterium]|nr:hypothetical protein [Actinomycetota bacterium]
MGMAAETTFSTGAVSPQRPRSVTVFVSCMGSFLLADVVTYYSPPFFPGVFLGLPILVSSFGLLAYGIWNGSRVLWLLNI